MRTFYISLAACLLFSTPCFAADATGPCTSSGDVMTELAKLNFELELHTAGYESGKVTADEIATNRMCEISYRMIDLFGQIPDKQVGEGSGAFISTVDIAKEALKAVGATCPPPPSESAKKP